MTRKDFDKLVRRMERRHAGRPAALERATTVWMALGLAGFLGWVGLLFAMGIAAFAGGVVLPFEAGVWLLIAGVFIVLFATSQAFLFFSVEHAPSQGHALRAAEAPALWAMLDSLCRELQCRPVDEVRITIEFNAGIREIPRLGFLGWPRGVLQLGLPLMEALVVDELRAVLAHEMAHGSARHARSASRIYRLHRTWSVLFQRMQRPVSGRSDRAIRAAASRFAGWYWPRLHARAMVLSRAHEYHADRVAVNCAGVDAVISALWRMECLEPVLSERFWEGVFREAEDSPDPPADIMDRLRSAFATPPSPADASRWVERGLSRTTGIDETHPAFRDRGRALGRSTEEIRQAGFPVAPRPSSAEALLGADRAAIESELAAEWQRSVVAGWRHRHRRATAEARRREAPGVEGAEAAAPAIPADAVAAWEAARASLELKGPAAAEPLLRAVLERDPRHAGASLVLGNHLLKLGDSEGRRMLEEVAAEADEFWMRQACQALHDHFKATGQEAELVAMRSRLDRLDEESAAAQRERATVRPGDSFLPHGLADDQLEPLRAVLAAQADCGAAWLVRKDLRYFPRKALFVLCVRRKTARWWSADPDGDRDLVRRLIPLVELPGQVLIVARSGSFRRLAAKVMSRPNAEVFRRDLRRPEPAETSPSELGQAVPG